MQLPLVAVVGGTDRIPDGALQGLQSSWRFARYRHATEVLKSGEAPQVVLIAERSSRSVPLIQALRSQAHTRAVLIGFGEDSSEEMLALTAASEGWVPLPATAESLEARLRRLQLEPELEPQTPPEPLAVRAGEGLLPALRTPCSLGPFRLEQLLGRGSFGSVFRAFDTRSGQPQAIKVVHPGVLDDPESRARWQREAALLKSVQLPGLVSIRGSGEVQGYTCLVMDLVPGDSLQLRIDREGPMPAEQVVPIAERLGRALGALHALGVLHRDVKPGNVVVDGFTGLATLVDLGLVRHVRSPQMTSSDVVMGTAGFLSPERIRGGRGAASDDAYALAATLYYALTGTPPFVHKSAIELIRRVSNGEPAPPIKRLQPHIPPELAELIDAMLLPRLESRPALSELVDWCFQATHDAS